jgi:AcrR family transcriptional regulator
VATAASPAGRTRDADRTRAAILGAAERLFARRGYDATSLADIGVAAGVSRGTPSYFFGSKDELYVAVLERMYHERNEALGPVFAPLVEWANAATPAEPLRTVLARCVEGYLEFLHGRPAFVAMMEREALSGGERLAALESESTVMEDAFGALRRRARHHGLRRFDVTEAIMCLVALGFLPVAHRTTLLRRHGLELDDPRFVRRRAKHITDLLLHGVGGAQPEARSAAAASSRRSAQ